MSKINIVGFFKIEDPKTSIVATAKVELYKDVVFMIKLIKGSNGFFVGLPNVWDKEKSKFVDSVTVSKETRLEIQQEVVNKYNEEKPAEIKKPEIPQNSDLDDDDDIPF